MTERLMDLHDIAQAAHISLGGVRTCHKRAEARRAAGRPRTGDLPAPDVIVGSRAGARPGWRWGTINAWLATRSQQVDYSRLWLRTREEEDALAVGLLWLVERRCGTRWPTVHNEHPEFGRDARGLLPQYEVRCRAAFTNGEAGLTDEQERVWGIDPDAFNEATVTISASWDDSPLIRSQRRLGRDPAREWLLSDPVMGRVPHGMVPIAIAVRYDSYGRAEWAELPDDIVDRMVRVVRERNSLIDEQAESESPDDAERVGDGDRDHAVGNGARP